MLSGSNTAQVKAFVGPLQSAEDVATVTCAWALGRGSAPSLPPSSPRKRRGGGTTPGRQPRCNNSSASARRRLNKEHRDRDADGSLTHWRRGPRPTVETDIGAPITTARQNRYSSAGAVRYPIPAVRRHRTASSNEVLTPRMRFTITPGCDQRCRWPEHRG
jgi:hypothetical protein